MLGDPPASVAQFGQSLSVPATILRLIPAFCNKQVPKRATWTLLLRASRLFAHKFHASPISEFSACYKVKNRFLACLARNIKPAD